MNYKKLIETALFAVGISYYGHLLEVRVPYGYEHGLPFDVGVDKSCMTWLSISTTAIAAFFALHMIRGEDK